MENQIYCIRLSKGNPNRVVDIHAMISQIAIEVDKPSTVLVKSDNSEIIQEIMIGITGIIEYYPECELDYLEFENNVSALITYTIKGDS